MVRVTLVIIFLSHIFMDCRVPLAPLGQNVPIKAPTNILVGLHFDLSDSSLYKYTYIYIYIGLLVLPPNKWITGTCLRQAYKGTLD